MIMIAALLAGHDTVQRAQMYVYCVRAGYVNPYPMFVDPTCHDSIEYINRQSSFPPRFALPSSERASQSDQGNTNTKSSENKEIKKFPVRFLTPHTREIKKMKREMP